MTACIETDCSRHSPHVVPVDDLSGRLDSEGHAKIVNRWPDADHAKNLRFAVAGEISFGVTENDGPVSLEGHRKDRQEPWRVVVIFCISAVLATGVTNGIGNTGIDSDCCRWRRSWRSQGELATFIAPLRAGCGGA
jgi:hypothetical protein